MRRVLGATVGVMLAACGISVVGVPAGDAPDGGVTSQPDGAVVLPDGAVVPADGAPDTAVTPSDAGPRPDAKVPPPTVACNLNNCNGTTNPCGVEKCTSGHWMTIVGGAAMKNTTGNCQSTTNGYMVQPLTATADDYRYGLGVVVFNTGTGTFTIGEIAVGGTTVVSLQAEDGVVKMCRPAATLPAACAGAITIGGGVVIGLYGRLSRTAPFGSATLARTSACDEVATFDIDIPPSGDVVARFGCIGGSGCSFQWYDARIELAPLL